MMSASSEGQRANFKQGAGFTFWFIGCCYLFVTAGTFVILYRDGIYKAENAATAVPLLRD